MNTSPYPLTDRAHEALCKLSAWRVSRRIGVSLTTVCRWQKRAARPRVSAARRLATVLDMPLHEVLEGFPTPAIPEPQRWYSRLRQDGTTALLTQAIARADDRPVYREQLVEWLFLYRRGGDIDVEPCAVCGRLFQRLLHTQTACSDRCRAMQRLYGVGEQGATERTEALSGRLSGDVTEREAA